MRPGARAACEQRAEGLNAPRCAVQQDAPLDLERSIPLGVTRHDLREAAGGLKRQRAAQRHLDDPSAPDHERSRASRGRRSTSHPYRTTAGVGGHSDARARSAAESTSCRAAR